jgi:hypothetical protein
MQTLDRLTGRGGSARRRLRPVEVCSWRSSMRPAWPTLLSPNPGPSTFPEAWAPGAPRQLQQAVGVAARGRGARRPRAALPRPAAHRQPVRRQQRGRLRDLMARMGHDFERAAMIYQHEARGADKAITDAINRHVDDERGHDDEGDDGPAGEPPVPA